MKKSTFLLCIGLALALSGFYTVASAAEKDEKNEAPPAVGSIRVTGKVAKAERTAMAKISFADGLAIAQATVPGKVVNGTLEVEDGNLQYAFEIVKADKTIDEVAIDAGNGKVLGIDHDDTD
jgi:uncharacterized membrane protein YkoI